MWKASWKDPALLYLWAWSYCGTTLTVSLPAGAFSTWPGAIRSLQRPRNVTTCVSGESKAAKGWEIGRRRRTSEDGESAGPVHVWVAMSTGVFV